MSTTKATGVAVIGGALLLVSTGTGYLVGRQQSKSTGGGVASESLAAESFAGLPASKGEGRGGTRGLARKNESEGDEISRVEAIVRSLKRELRGKEFPDARKRGREIVRELMASDMEEAVSLVGGEEEQLRHVLFAVLFEYWGEVDGGFAVGYGVELEDQDSRRLALTAAVPAWAAVDPGSAWEWQSKLQERTDLPVTERTAKHLAGLVLREWAKKDVDRAWDEFERLDRDAQSSALHQLDELIVEAEQTESMARRMAAIADERVRARVAEEVGEKWARVDPEAAGAWFKSLEFSDPMLRMRSAMEIGEGWFEVDPAAAASWMWPIIPEAMRSEFAGMLSRSPWAQEDPAGLAAWLEGQGLNQEELRKD